MSAIEVQLGTILPPLNPASPVGKKIILLLDHLDMASQWLAVTTKYSHLLAMRRFRSPGASDSHGSKHLDIWATCLRAVRVQFVSFHHKVEGKPPRADSLKSLGGFLAAACALLTVQNL